MNLYIEDERPAEPGQERIGEAAGELQSRSDFQAWSLQLACDRAGYW